MSIKVRPLQPSDYEEWLVLWRGYLEFYETSITDDVTAETWRRLLDPRHTVSGFCAVDSEGRLVGIVHYLFHPVTWAKSDRCYLEDLFVSPDARVKGAGRALIEAVYQAAEEAGADQVYWLTAESNMTARRLYDRIGHVTPFIKYRN